MPEETFRIRIKRDGTIHFYSRRLGEERMRLLREMIEDCLGPVTEIRAGEDEGPDPGARIFDKEKRRRLRQESR